MKIYPVSITQPLIPECSTPEELVAYCARISNPSNQANHMTASGLLKYLYDNEHWSPFEMVDLTIGIETTRDIARQILRHRSFSFQEFCVSGDTMITSMTKGGKSKKISIEELYKRQLNTQYHNMSDNLVRVYDTETKSFVSRKIKEVFDTGIKPVYEVLLDNGKSIKATEDHKLFTFNGFRRIGDISIDDDFVGCNGIPLHQDKQWLTDAKELSIKTKGGLGYIAELAGVKPVTISKWLRHYNMQFTKKEVASYTDSWNKGLEKELQPRYMKPTSSETRAKMRDSASKGIDSNLYSTGNFTNENLSWRRRVANICRGELMSLLKSQNYKCAISGDSISIDTAEVDHILPVYARPDLAFDITNLRAVSKEAHAQKTFIENKESKKTVKYSKIKHIKYIGEIQTYDMEIDHVDHNYVANGIVTHNSQRYADSVDELGFVLREARLQDEKNRQNSIETDDAELKRLWDIKQEQLIHEATLAYKWARENNIAKEQARAVLPEGNTVSRLYMKGSLRSWIHYCALRSGNGTQKEHREIAQRAWKEIITKYFPSIVGITD